MNWRILGMMVDGGMAGSGGVCIVSIVVCGGGRVEEAVDDVGGAC